MIREDGWLEQIVRESVVDVGQDVVRRVLATGYRDFIRGADAKGFGWIECKVACDFEYFFCERAVESPSPLVGHYLGQKMIHKKRNHGLTEEQLAVLQSSPNLEPCRKFRNADIFKFVEHLNEGKCEQCLAFFRQLNIDQQLMKFLRDKRN